jgi:DNA-binding transcriptional ArsR family regulator
VKPSDIQFALNLEVLSAPQSRRIVQALIERPLTAQDLAKTCKLSLASIAKHLEPLMRAKLVALTSVDGVEMLKFERSTLQRTIEWFADLNQ